MVAVIVAAGVAMAAEAQSGGVAHAAVSAPGVMRSMRVLCLSGSADSDEHLHHITRLDSRQAVTLVS